MGSTEFDFEEATSNHGDKRSLIFLKKIIVIIYALNKRFFNRQSFSRALRF